MKIKSHPFAFGKLDDAPRPIDIPDECVTLKDRLNAGFKFGQNDFQPRDGFYSVSVGDVLEIEECYYIVRACGFDELTPEEFSEHAKNAGKAHQWLDGPTQGKL
jgi:hypothetical protein